VQSGQSGQYRSSLPSTWFVRLFDAGPTTSISNITFWIQITDHRSCLLPSPPRCYEHPTHSDHLQDFRPLITSAHSRMDPETEDNESRLDTVLDLHAVSAILAIHLDRLLCSCLEACDTWLGNPSTAELVTIHWWYQAHRDCLYTHWDCFVEHVEHVGHVCLLVYP
jgi:hypothetical protein